jgi:predicted Zn finger-like uncharacterized protein
MVSDSLTLASLRSNAGRIHLGATMLITCPNCATSYDLDRAAIGAGRPVRCARCQTTWRAELPEREEIFSGDFERAWSLPNERGAAPQLDGAEPPYLDEPPTAVTALVPAMPAGAEERDIYGPPLVPIQTPLDDGGPTIDVHPSEDVETVAARRERPHTQRRARQRSSFPLAGFVVVACLMIAGSLFQWRAQVVRIAPQTAAIYGLFGLDVNLRGLAFRNVKTSSEMHEGMPVLVVEGDILNVAQSAVDVPRMRFSVRNEAGLEVYAWTAQPSKTIIGKGEALPFRSRLASPPADTQEVMVRFFSRRDLAEAGRS